MTQYLSDREPILKYGNVQVDLFGGGESGSPSGVVMKTETGTAYYLFAGTGGLRVHTSLPTDDGDGSLVVAGTNGVTTSNIADASVTQPKMIIREARTATADGTGTGTISDTATDVTVTCDDANKIIILPAPTPGRVVRIINGATGYELRSSNPETVSINGGTGANAESAIAANMVVEARCVSATKWIANQYTAAGTESAVEAAA